MMAMSPTTHPSSPMGHPPFLPAIMGAGGGGPSSSGPIQTDPKKVILNGYLMKLGTRGKRSWRKRWFVLTSGELVYTKSHMVSGAWCVRIARTPLIRLRGVAIVQDTKVHRQIPLSNILDAIEIESAEVDGSSESDSDAGGDMSKSPTSPRKPRHVAHHHPLQSHGGRPDVIVRHAFQVITPQRTFKLCAPSEEEEIKWLAALRALINRERGLMSPSMTTTMSSQPLSSGIPRLHQQPPTPSTTHSAQGEEASYFTQPLGQPIQTTRNHVNMGGGSGTPLTGFSYPIQTSNSRTSNVSSSKPSPSQLPPLITSTPVVSTHHHRTRSATQSAKAAVAEVVRRFNPEAMTTST
jgi:hypothetical protein